MLEHPTHLLQEPADRHLAYPSCSHRVLDPMQVYPMHSRLVLAPLLAGQMDLVVPLVLVNPMDCLADQVVPSLAVVVRLTNRRRCRLASSVVSLVLVLDPTEMMRVVVESALLQLLLLVAGVPELTHPIDSMQRQPPVLIHCYSVHCRGDP